MTVELTDDEAREIAELLRAGERHLIAEFASDPVDVDDTDAGQWANQLEERTDDGDYFDELWADYEDMDKDVSAALGLDPLTDGDDAETRKERCRELWESGQLIFVGNTPIIQTHDGEPHPR